MLAWGRLVVLHRQVILVRVAYHTQGSGCEINAPHTQGSGCETNASQLRDQRLSQHQSSPACHGQTAGITFQLSPSRAVGGVSGFDVASSGTPFGSTPTTQRELFNQLQLSLYRVSLCSPPGRPAATRPAATRFSATPSLFLSNQLLINTTSGYGIHSSRSLCGVKPSRS